MKERMGLVTVMVLVTFLLTGLATFAADIPEVEKWTIVEKNQWNYDKGGFICRARLSSQGRVGMTISLLSARGEEKLIFKEWKTEEGPRAAVKTKTGWIKGKPAYNHSLVEVNSQGEVTGLVLFLASDSVPEKYTFQFGEFGKY